MTQTEQGERQEDLRRLLKEAIEVQLAALKAGISFWTEWIEQTGEFVNSATTTLASINAEDQQAKDVLLELVDASRASMRSMTEIPRHSALRFIEELDRLREKQDAETAAKKAARKATSKATSKTTGSAAKQATPKVTKSGVKKVTSKLASASGESAAKRTASGAGAQRSSGSSRPRRAGRVKS
jgi:exonuclease V gamma subunit